MSKYPFFLLSCRIFTWATSSTSTMVFVTKWNITIVSTHLVLWPINTHSTPIQLVNRIVTRREHPEPLRPFLPEIDAFARHNHQHVLHSILRWECFLNNIIAILNTCYRLFALGLELPEETLVNLHRFDAVGESSGIHKIITPISFIDELFRPL